MKVLALVDRATGRSRAIVVDRVTAADIVPHLKHNLAREAQLVTDENPVYFAIGKTYAGHRTVQHKINEYVRGEVHTNTIEGYFGIFKRGMKGVYQHCGKQHLHRYLAEFDFRYTFRQACGLDDAARASEALKGIYGRRLTYRRACI